MAAHLPKHFSLVIPIIDCWQSPSGSVLTNVVLLEQDPAVRVADASSSSASGRWPATWSSPGCSCYVFAHDHTPAGPMAVLAGMLATFAIDIPMLFGFSVARFQEPDRTD